MLRTVLAALTIFACTSPGAQEEMPFEFGKLRAKLNANDFVGVFGRDSIIAIWDTASGQMQIEGDKRGGHRPVIVRFLMRCTALAKPGNYEVRSPFTPVSAEAFLQPTTWQRIWPLRGDRTRSFLSDSMPPGSLILDTVDSTNRVLKGRFSASLRSVNKTPAETLHVRGTFLGRFDVQPTYPRPAARWSPMFDRDCERIRNAVSM